MQLLLHSNIVGIVLLIVDRFYFVKRILGHANAVVKLLENLLIILLLVVTKHVLYIMASKNIVKVVGSASKKKHKITSDDSQDSITMF